jgi:hypothetical protein
MGQTENRKDKWKRRTRERWGLWKAELKEDTSSITHQRNIHSPELTTQFAVNLK